MSYAARPLRDRFWPKTQRNQGTGCLIWTGATNIAGYGRIRREGGRVILAHRAAWLIAGRTLTPQQELDHQCRTILCCEVTHLEEVSHRENVARGASPSAAAHRTGICGRGHPMTAEHGRRYRGKWYCQTCRRSVRQGRY